MTIKWVSPTGKTVMHENPDGTVYYEFPTDKHPQLPYTDTSNRATHGLANNVTAALQES